MPGKDRFGRGVNYLRVSVTPRCNLRCAYCFPASGEVRPHNGDILSIKEIARLIRIFSAAGMRKIRLTGGEPLLRKGLSALVREIKTFSTIDEVALTTNGVLLNEKYDRLKEAGLDRLNVSLDSLDPIRLHKITGYDVFARIMRGLTRVMEDGAMALKINVVPVEGVNDDEVFNFVRFAMEHPAEVRFIELMPSAGNTLWGHGKPISCTNLKTEIEKRFTLTPLVRGGINGPANVFSIEGGIGRIGFVCPVSNHFCDSCNRMRLTAEGKLRSCLFSDNEVDLRQGLTEACEDDWFLQQLETALACKPERHQISESSCADGLRPMTAIGG